MIIADEPTGNLDEEISQEIMDLMKDIVEKDHKTIVMVTHNKDLAVQTDKIFLVKRKGLEEIEL